MEQGAEAVCTKCGANASGNFCGSCGTPLGSGAEKPAPALAPEPLPATVHARHAPKPVKIANEAAHEVRELLPLFLQPLRHLGEVKKSVWRTAAIVAAAGILPLIIITALGHDEVTQYWAVALYFSALWGVFFYYIFMPKEFKAPIAVGAFFFTGLISMTLLMAVLAFGLEALRDPLINMHFAPVTIPAAVLFIGVPEELTKALALFVIARFLGVPPLRTFLVYGLVSGLGFGIYEGISYQTGQNLAIANASHDVGIYYLLNLLRLTALPFLHAIWTGFAAYFIWFAAKFPTRRLGLYVMAIAVPAILHGLYDGVGMSGIGGFAWPIALISAIVLCIYIGSADSVEQRLTEAFGGTEVAEAAPVEAPAPA